MSDRSTTTVASQQPSIPSTYSDLTSLRSIIQDTFEQSDNDPVLDVRLFFKLLRHVSLCLAITVVILLVHIVVFILLALIFADKSEDSSKQGFWSYSTLFVFIIILLLFLYSLYRIVKLFFIRIVRSFSTEETSTQQRRSFGAIIKEQVKQTVQEFLQTIQVVFHVSPQQEQISSSELRHLLIEVLGLGLINSTRQRRRERDLEQQTEEDVEETSNLLLGTVATEENTNMDHLRRHLRLSLMNREFNENDYETLLSLDEHEQEMRDFIQGCSISDLQTLPQLRILPIVDSTITPKTPRNDIEATKQETPLDQPSQESENTIPYCSESLAKTILQQKCSICLHRFEGNEIFVTLPACLHRFHKECVFEWLSRKNSCPICTHPALQ